MPSPDLSQYVHRGEHINLAPHIRQGFEGIAPLLHKDYSIPSNLAHADIETRNAWIRKHKDIINGVTSLLTKDVWERITAMENFITISSDKEELREHVQNHYSHAFNFPHKDNEDTLDVLKLYTLVMCVAGVRDWAKNMATLEAKDPRKITFDWLTKVLAVRETVVHDNISSVEQLIDSGFGTAVSTIYNTLDLLPRVYENYKKTHGQLTLEEAQAIDISFLIKALASGNQTIVIQLLNTISLETTSDITARILSLFDPSYFHIREDAPGRRALGIIPGKLAEATYVDPRSRKRRKISELTSPSNTSGCPALYTKAINELLAWSQNAYRLFRLTSI